jgi:hypothetical protein
MYKYITKYIILEYLNVTAFTTIPFFKFCWNYTHSRFTNIYIDRNLAFSLYTCAWKFASEKNASLNLVLKYAPPLNLAAENTTFPKNCEPEKYIGKVPC